MIRHVFCCKDSAADTFGQPFFAPSIGVAVRSFTDEVNRADQNNELYKHPDDFILYEVGTFDDDVCVFDCHVPRQLTRGVDVKVREK